MVERHTKPTTETNCVSDEGTPTQGRVVAKRAQPKRRAVAKPATARRRSSRVNAASYRPRLVPGVAVEADVLEAIARSEAPAKRGSRSNGTLRDCFRVVRPRRGVRGKRAAPSTSEGDDASSDDFIKPVLKRQRQCAAKSSPKKPTGPVVVREADARRSLRPPPALTQPHRVLQTQCVLHLVERALHTSSVPSSLEGRGDKISEISGFVERALAAGRGGSLYLCGGPGTGKTTCVVRTEPCAGGSTRAWHCSPTMPRVGSQNHCLERFGNVRRSAVRVP